MIRAGSILSPILKNLGIENDVRLARIRKNWEKIFDKPLSSHTSPSNLSECELIINVDSPIWIQQLSYFKKDITEKLVDYGVRDVRFRLGRITRKKNFETEKQKTSQLSSEENAFVSELVSKVNDEKLRDAIKGALEKSLGSVNPAHENHLKKF